MNAAGPRGRRSRARAEKCIEATTPRSTARSPEVLTTGKQMGGDDPWTAPSSLMDSGADSAPLDAARVNPPTPDHGIDDPDQVVEEFPWSGSF